MFVLMYLYILMLLSYLPILLYYIYFSCYMLFRSPPVILILSICMCAPTIVHQLTHVKLVPSCVCVKPRICVVVFMYVVKPPEAILLSHILFFSSCKSVRAVQFTCTHNIIFHMIILWNQGRIFAQTKKQVW